MSVETIWLLIFSLPMLHWYADFFLQSDWCARNKHNNMNALTAHVFIYFCYLFFSLLLIFFTKFQISNILLFVFANSLAHWLIDFVSSRFTFKLFSKGDYHTGFIVVGLDQLLHFYCFILTAPILIG